MQVVAFSRRLILLSLLPLVGCSEWPGTEPNARVTVGEVSQVVSGSFVWGVYSGTPDAFRLAFFGRVTIGRWSGPVSFSQDLTPGETSDLASGMTTIPSVPAVMGYENGGGSFRLRAIESLTLVAASPDEVTVEALLGPPLEENAAPGPSSTSMTLVAAAMPGCYLDGTSSSVPPTADDWAASECAASELEFGLTPLLDAVFLR